MCVEISAQNMSQLKQKSDSKKVSYSIKKLLKQLFKQHKSEKQIILAQNFSNSQKADSLESLESLENSRNEAAECNHSLESFENDINERLSSAAYSCELEDYDMSELSSTVPVHFVRTEHGTFFWTASSDIPADNDLIEPLYCCTRNEIAVAQDRWAQA